MNRLFVILSLLFVLFAAKAHTDWPHFLGPHHNDISDETGLLERWSTNGPPLGWEKKIGTGYGAPSVFGNLLVLFHRMGDEEIVEAMDSATGKPRWTHKDPSSFVDPFGY